MATILKKPNQENKGIIVFTHKEDKYFFEKSNLFIRNKIKKKLIRLKNRYFLGVHFGWINHYKSRFRFYNFLLATESVLRGTENKKESYIIPLRSRNFTPDFFHPNRDYEKHWDIICVSNNTKNKNLKYLLKSIRKIYDMGYYFRVLLISPERKNEKNNKKFYQNLEKDYLNHFSCREREYFTLIRPNAKFGFLGFSQSEMAFFYNSSKVFTLFSEKEGGPKAVSEALLSGNLIVVHSKLEGGGRDFLNNRNSIQFKNFDEAYMALIQAVEKYHEYKPETDMLKRNLSENESIKVLNAYLDDLYKIYNQQFDKKLDRTHRLNLALSAHESDEIPWGKSIEYTSDIQSYKQFNIFYEYT